LSFGSGPAGRPGGLIEPCFGNRARVRPRVGRGAGHPPSLGTPGQSRGWRESRRRRGRAAAGGGTRQMQAGGPLTGPSRPRLRPARLTSMQGNPAASSSVSCGGGVGGVERRGAVCAQEGILIAARAASAARCWGGAAWPSASQPVGRSEPLSRACRGSASPLHTRHPVPCPSTLHPKAPKPPKAPGTPTPARVPAAARRAPRHLAPAGCRGMRPSGPLGVNERMNAGLERQSTGSQQAVWQGMGVGARGQAQCK
jgi:hypothetical protein